MQRLQARDVEGYLAKLTPEAQAIERPIAVGSQMVPLTGVELRLNPGSVEPTSPRLVGVKVDFRYRYEGLTEDNVFRIPLVYDLEFDSEGWQVLTARLGDGASLPVWATGPIHAERTEHFLGLFRPGLADARRILAQAEQARAQLDGKITFPLENVYLLLMARNGPEYEAMTSARLGQVSAVAQVETSYEVTPDSPTQKGRIQVQSRQIIVNVEQLTKDNSALETFRHELGHLAVAQYTRPFTPAWVSESAAMYLAGTRPTAIWRSGLNRRAFDSITFDELTRASNLGEHDSSREAISLNYAYAAAAGWYLVETFGPERYWEFYRSFAEVPANALYQRLPEADDPNLRDEAIEALAVQTTESSLLRIFGLDTAGLDFRARQWMGAVSR
ncbi:MAG: hypothetical protein M3164_06345 [Actinomycetota bacterium]|nr:hypothetical protein [Actinomycetota bacterium]